MVDDRSQPGEPAPDVDVEVHDDDELAEVLAAELERYATGAVPMIVAGAPRPVALRPSALPVVAAPPVAPAARSGPPSFEPSRFAPAPRAQPAPPARQQAEVRDDDDVDDPTPASNDGGSPAAETTRRSRAAERGPQGASFAARVAEVQRQYPDTGEVFRRGAERADASSARRGAAAAVAEDGEPLRRRSGFRPPQTAPAAAAPPLEPVLPTAPTAVPSAAGPDSALIDEDDRPPRARHAAPVTGAMPTLPRGADGATPARAPQHSTGQVPISSTLYEDWEQSLRLIGRPGDLEPDDGELIAGASVDTPTVALTVPPRTRPEPRVDTAPPAAEPDDAPRRATRRRRAGRRDAALDGPMAPPAPASVPASIEPPSTVAGAPAPSPAPAVASPAAPASWFAPTSELVPPRGDDDDEGLDEIVTPYPERRAGDTAAVDVPVIEPRPRTGPLFIERVRTAILQLPSVPPSPTGTGGPAILGRWFGAFASPLLLVLAFGLAAVGAGPASIGAVLLGAALALPGAIRAALWAAGVGDDTAMLETAVLGPRAGRVLGTVLLITRLFVAALLLVAIADLASAYVARTGVLGGNPSTAAVVAVVVAGVVALAASAWPHRVTGVLVLVLGAVGVLVTVVVLLLVAPGATGAPAPVSAGVSAAGAVAAGTVAFGVVGLLLLLVGGELVRWRTDLPRRVPTVVATVLSVVVGVGVLAFALMVAVGSGSTGDGADAFVGALVDSTATALAAPLAIALLAAVVTLPALVLRATGDAAVRLIGGGPRSSGLATVSCALLAIAAALGVIAGGLDAPTLAVVVGGVLGVPLAAWAGVLCTAPLRAGGAARGPLVGVLVVAVVLGWALADGLGVLAERSPVLDALHLAGAWRGGPAVGLAVALVLGVVGGLLARTAGRGAPRRPATTPVASVAG